MSKSEKGVWKDPHTHTAPNFVSSFLANLAAHWHQQRMRPAVKVQVPNNDMPFVSITFGRDHLIVRRADIHGGYEEQAFASDPLTDPNWDYVGEDVKEQLVQLYGNHGKIVDVPSRTVAKHLKKAWDEHCSATILFGDFAFAIGGHADKGSPFVFNHGLKWRGSKSENIGRLTKIFKDLSNPCLS